MGIVQFRKFLPNRAVPRLTGSNVQGRTTSHQLENFSSRMQRHPHAAHGAGLWLDESPVHSVGRFEFHPVSHRISRARATDPPTIGLLGINRKVTMRCWGRSFSNRDRSRQQDSITFHDIESLGTGAELHFYIGRIFWSLDRRVESKGVLWLRGDGRAGTHP